MKKQSILISLSLIYGCLIGLTFVTPLLGEEVAVAWKTYTVEENHEGTLRSIGKGLAPKMDLTLAQKRVFSRRAAILDGYEKLLHLLQEVGSHLDEGQGEWKTRGFVQGVQVVETRYFEDGGVEVLLELPVKFTGEPAYPPQELMWSASPKVVDLDKGIFIIDRDEWESFLIEKVS